MFAHNGLAAVTDLTERTPLTPWFDYDPVRHEIVVFWQDSNTGQSRWGVSGQRFDEAGNRQWGAAGATVLARSGDQSSNVVALSTRDGGAMVFWFDLIAGTGTSYDFKGARINSDGTLGWGGAPIDVVAFTSQRSRMDIARGPDNAAMLVWMEGPVGSDDVLAQRVNADGTLGVPPPSACRADFNHDSTRDVADIFAFLSAWFSHGSGSDFNGDTQIDVSDIFAFLSAWFAGCP